MDLIVNRNIIKCDVEELIARLNVESGYRYFNIPTKLTPDNIQLQCPFHNEGQEKRPSASILISDDNPDVTQYTFHCFACGTKMSLPRFISKVLDISLEKAREWLVENYSAGVSVDVGGIVLDEPITIDHPTISEKSFLEESVLNDFSTTSSYLEGRGISREIQSQFQCGEKDGWVGFPVRDYIGRLVGITKRNVYNKIYHIPKGMDKTVYLLDYIIKRNIKNVYVCESQINALTLWSWGYPSIALMGTGSYKQYDILKHSGIFHYTLCLDGDEAGFKGMKRFLKNMPNADVSVKEIPWGKDVNDLTKSDFDSLKCNSRSVYEKL